MIEYEKMVIIPDFAFRGRKFTALKPIKSFFSPIKGIPQGTVLTLSGDIGLAYEYDKYGVRIILQFGVYWGKNLKKRRDWVNYRDFRRATVFSRDIPFNSSSKARSAINNIMKIGLPL